MSTPTDLQTSLNAIQWTNGRGLVTGATLLGVMTLVLGVFATLGTWGAGGVFTPNIPAGTITSSMLAPDITSGLVPPTGITPGSYGDATDVPTFTVGADGRLTSVTPTPITAPPLPASGVSAGSYGDAADVPTFAVGADGRLTSAAQTPIPESIYAKMRRVISASRYNNARTLGVMASPPTVTIINGSGSTPATPPSGLTQIFAVDGATAGVFTPLGGPSVFVRRGGFATNYAAILTNTAPALPYSTMNFRWSAMIDSAKFAFRVYGASVPVRILVNNQYVSLTGVSPTANDAYVVVDFTSAGGRANRKIELESSGIAFGFYSVSVAPTEGVDKAAPSPLRVIFLGDSYMADTVPGGNVNDGLPTVMGDYLGMEDEWTEGQGGTGYITAFGNYQPYISHIGDIINNNPDVIVVGTAANDQFYGNFSGITTAVTALIAAVRAGPTTKTTPMFMVGAWANQFGVTATNLAADAAVGAAVSAARAAGDTNVFYIPCVADPNGSWMTGTGNTGNLKGDGNLDVYGAPDGAHLNVAGWNFMAQRFTDQILQTIKGVR